MSFRKKVLDALDIKRDHVRIPVYQTFRNPAYGSDANVDPASVQTVEATAEPYAVSKCVKKQIIGPKNRAERLEVLGFVVGEDPGDHGASVQQPLRNGFLSSLPDCTDREGTQKHTGFHYLGGLYDSSNARLQAMRKSCPMPLDMQTQYQEVDAAAAGDFHRLAHPADIVRALHGHADRLRHLLPLRGQLAEVAAAISVPAAQRCTVNAWRKSRGGTRFVASYRCWYSRAPGRQRSPPAPFTQYLSSPPKMRESIGVVVGRSTMLAHAGSCRSCRVAEQQPKE